MDWGINYEVDLEKGIFKSNGTREDHQDMMDFISSIDRVGLKVQRANPPTPKHGGDKLKAPIGLRLPEILEKFFELKKQLTPATAIAYKKAVNEFAAFTGNQYIQDYDKSDVTRYMENIAKFNEPRTIDGKIGVLSTIFNFAIKQGYYFKSTIGR